MCWGMPRLYTLHSGPIIWFITLATVCALEIISWLSITSQSHRVIAESETPVFNIDPARHEVEALQLSM